MKQNIAASYSTLSADALGEWISEAYGFDRCLCSFLLRGVGDTYLVEEAETKYVFRVYRSGFRTLPDVEIETGLLHELHKAGVSVSYPIKNLSGDYINVIAAAEGERFAVLFSFAHGRSYQQLSEVQLQNLGREMAAFHNVSATLPYREGVRRFNIQTTLYEPIASVEQYFSKDPEAYEWLKRSADEASRYLSSLDTSKFSSGYCQFDFLPKNFHFDGDNKITLFDFDFVGYGWLINDLMTFWVHLSLDIFFNRLTKEDGQKNFKTFIESYRTVRPVSDEEVSAIPALSLGFWVFYMGFHATHDQFYGMIKEPGQLKLRMGLIRKLFEQNFAAK